MSYADDLRDPRWQKKRLHLLNSASWQCAECGCEQRTLEVHHCWYEPKTKPWEYSDDCYRVLCEDCHERWHAAKLECDKMFAGYSLTQFEQAAGVLAGLNCAANHQDFEIGGSHDALFLSGLIRGWWGPPQYTNSLIDAGLSRIHCGQTPFRLSRLVREVIPYNENHAWVYRWLEAVEG